MQRQGETTRATPATDIPPNRRVRSVVAAGLIAATMLGACGQERGVWAWPAADASVRAGGTMPATRGGPDAAGASNESSSPVSPGVAVFPSWGFAEEPGPETVRRDSAIASRTNDALPGRLAWPSGERPDLRYQRVYRSSRQADTFTFPSQRRDQFRVRVIVPAYPGVYPGGYRGPYPGPYRDRFRGW